MRVAPVNESAGHLTVVTELHAVHRGRSEPVDRFGRVSLLGAVDIAVTRGETPVLRRIDREPAGVRVQADGIEVPAIVVRLVRVECGYLESNYSREYPRGHDPEADVGRVLPMVAEGRLWHVHRGRPVHERHGPERRFARRRAI